MKITEKDIYGNWVMFEGKNGIGRIEKNYYSSGKRVYYMAWASVNGEMVWETTRMIKENAIAKIKSLID